MSKGSSRAFFYLFLVVTLVILSIVLWQVKFKGNFSTLTSRVSSLEEKKSTSEAETSALADKVTTAAQERTALETKVNTLGAYTQRDQQLEETQNQELGTLKQSIEKLEKSQKHTEKIALLRGVLEGTLPLKALKVYLENTDSPSAKALLKNLHPITVIKTIPELEGELQSSQKSSSSFFEKIRNMFRITVRTADKDDNTHTSRVGIKNLKIAIHSQNLGKVLVLYKALSTEQRKHLSSWIKDIRNRFLLEESLKTCLEQIIRGESS